MNCANRCDRSFSIPDERGNQLLSNWGPCTKKWGCRGTYGQHCVKQADEGGRNLKERHPQIVTDQPFDWPDQWSLGFVCETREKVYHRAEQISASWRIMYAGKSVRLAAICLLK